MKREAEMAERAEISRIQADMERSAKKLESENARIRASMREALIKAEKAARQAAAKNSHKIYHLGKFY